MQYPTGGLRPRPGVYTFLSSRLLLESDGCQSEIRMIHSFRVAGGYLLAKCKPIDFFIGDAPNFVIKKFWGSQITMSGIPLEIR
jgi:hypothetical protein